MGAVTSRRKPLVDLWLFFHFRSGLSFVQGAEENFVVSFLIWYGMEKQRSRVGFAEKAPQPSFSILAEGARLGYGCRGIRVTAPLRSAWSLIIPMMRTRTGTSPPVARAGC